VPNHAITKRYGVGTTGVVFKRVFSAGEKIELRQSRGRCMDFDGVDFSGADLRGCRFERVSLRGANLARADLRGARFVTCDFSRARVDGVVLGGTRFVGCNLAGVAGLDARQIQYLRQRALRPLRKVAGPPGPATSAR
jgi:uncharacterized protein YjbI with pentapeptide repeats